VKCLDKSRQAAPLRCRQQKCPGSPVVRPAVVEPGCGMLTERQMAWVEEFPHESSTENPVLYKYVFFTIYRLYIVCYSNGHRTFL